MELEVGDIVLCTVEKIVGTTVFVNINELNEQGFISLSEIAPGRIRNIRDYVVPKKTIICKVLKMSGKTIELSLRRVTPKEQKDLRERHKHEKSYTSILKTIFGEKSGEIIKKIVENENIVSFLENAKEHPKELEKIAGKENAIKILEILKIQKYKKAIITKVIKIVTKKPEGVKIIKEFLQEMKNVQKKYLSAGKYSVKLESTDMKKADSEIKKMLENIEKKAKEQGIEFSILEK